MRRPSSSSRSLLLIYFAIASSAFLSESNITNLLSGFAAPIIIISIGEVLLLICGEIDLSVGFVFVFAPFLMHYMIDFYGIPVLLAIVLSLALGAGGRLGQRVRHGHAAGCRRSSPRSVPATSSSG